MFTESERKIFGPYHDGEREVYADPLALRRRLSVCMGGDAQKVVADYNSTDQTVKDQAATVFFAAIAEAFGIKKLFDPLTGFGFTELDLLRLWEKFQEWSGEKKNPPENSPPSSPPTGCSGLPRQP